MRPNKMKETLAGGGWSAGTIIPVADAALVEVCGLVGWDHVLIDAEHGHITVKDCEDLVRAAHMVGITPIVRVPTNAPHEILRYLDTGAQGVMVPQVTTREDAERAVAAAKYRPEGIARAGGRARGGVRATRPARPYAREANEQILVAALIEDVRAIDNLAGILAVEGLDSSPSARRISRSRSAIPASGTTPPCRRQSPRSSGRAWRRANRSA